MACVPFLLLLILVAGCASSGQELQRGSAVTPRPPPLRPGHGAPVSGQPGQQIQALPRSPHRRILPPSREPGIWAGDAPRESQPRPGQEAPPLTLQDAQETPMDEALAERIRAALQACADKAYGDTLRKHLGGRRPTDAECEHLVTHAGGEQMTLAMWLGLLMHDEAQRCAAETLSQLKPRGFSTSPRYQRVPRDPANKNPDPKKPEDWRTEWIDPRKESLLRSHEKLGSIVPDDAGIISPKGTP